NITASNQAKMICRIADTHLFSGTATRYYPLGEELMPDLLADLASAEKFIYLEFFIIEEGLFWNSILDILKEKAAAGVEVKVVFDDIGCMQTLPGNYAKQLKKMGIDATPFSRLRGQADSEFNNRSHRKIAVIDGKIGYTGGINLADEYINAIEKYGHWKDVGIRLEGEAVWELTRLFLTDYGINVKEVPELLHDVYPECRHHEGYGYILPFGDGPSPLYSHRVGKSVIQSMLAAANKYAWMMTPYLIIDNDLCQSIENAAMRGVDVRIIVPHIPDKKMVFAMTRSFYPRLCKASVKIYEYEPGFVHAKCYLVDDEYAMVGTINLDYRSLVHHFENGVWLYHSPILPDIKDDFERTLEKSIAVDGNVVKLNLIQRLFRAIVRIFAPLM
ncbi:MAG: cardiolipin synthase, partial [Clostridia bacterium]|nr:cardiolipin synthase [Clostridia bacterium]